jgi:hypothetical protein
VQRFLVLACAFFPSLNLFKTLFLAIRPFLHLFVVFLVTVAFLSLDTAFTFEFALISFKFK